MMGGSTPWLLDLLGAELPAETRSTCSACAMVRPAGAAAGEARRTWFAPDVRCCTFEPALPNYMVGRILRDGDPALTHGRESVRARLRHQADATPWGLRTSARFRALYRTGTGVFGRAPDLACPHLTDGTLGCGIWPHRPIVCATWHCKHDRGQAGQAVWRAVEKAVREIERVLGIWCVHQVGAGPGALPNALREEGRDALAEDLGGTVDPHDYRHLWGDWTGREEAFYVTCTERVDSLTWPDVLRLGGAPLEALVTLAREARRQFEESALPVRLQLGDVHIQAGDPGTVHLGTYSQYDPLQVPEVLLQILPKFNGRRTDETLADIETQHHVRVERNLVRKLVDFGVLRPTEAE